MNISNLYEGQTFKNYKELCEAIGDTPKAGKSKILHLKKLSDKILYHRDGYRYIIDKILEEPVLLIDGRGGSSKKLNRSDLFIDLLILGLSDVNENTIIINTRNLMQMCGFVNSSFFANYDNHNKYSKESLIDDDIVRDVFAYSNGRLYKDINVYLKKMESQRLIRVNKITYIETIDGSKRRATDMEISFILDAENKALKDMSISNFHKIGYRWNEFITKVNAQLRDNSIPDIDKYYHMKEIVLAQKSLKARAEVSKVNLIKSSLNNSIYVSFLEGIKRRSKKALTILKDKQNDYNNSGFGRDVDIKLNELKIAESNPCVKANYIDLAKKVLIDNIIIKDLDNTEELTLETKIDIIL